MSKRVLLGKIDGSDYGLLVSRAGVDVTNANADQLIFDSRQKGYGQLIFEETITVTRDGFSGGSITSNSQTRTFSEYFYTKSNSNCIWKCICKSNNGR